MHLIYFLSSVFEKNRSCICEKKENEKSIFKILSFKNLRLADSFGSTKMVDLTIIVLMVQCFKFMYIHLRPCFLTLSCTADTNNTKRLTLTSGRQTMDKDFINAPQLKTPVFSKSPHWSNDGLQNRLLTGGPWTTKGPLIGFRPVFFNRRFAISYFGSLDNLLNG